MIWLRHDTAFRNASGDPELQWVFLLLMIEAARTHKYCSRTLSAVANTQREGHPEDLIHWRNIFNKTIALSSSASQLLHAYDKAPSNKEREALKKIIAMQAAKDEEKSSRCTLFGRRDASLWQMYIYGIDTAINHKDLAFARWAVAGLATHVTDGKSQMELENRHVRVRDLAAKLEETS
jgi:hypothetical protein